MNLFTHLRVWQVLTGWMILFSYAKAAQAQCPQASFTLPDTVCIGEPVNILNTSTGATRYEWDFCSGDLDANPTLKEVMTIASGSFVTGTNIVFDGNNWFGFACSRANNQIIRLDFGNSLENTPTVKNLGNIGGRLLRPNDMVFRNEDGHWYALIANLGLQGVGFSNRVIRIDFGASLINDNPTVSDIQNLSYSLDSPIDLELVEDSDEVFVLVNDYTLRTVSVVRFGSSLANDPKSTDIIQSEILPGSTNLYGISAIKDCGKWYAFVTSYNKKLYRLDFTTSLLTIPIINDISSGMSEVFNTAKLKIVIDKEPVGLVLSEPGYLYKLDFRGNLLNVPSAKKYELIPDNFSYDFDIIKTESQYYGFITNTSNNKLYRFDFQNKCNNSSISVSAQRTPNNLIYSDTGKKLITLKVTKNDNSVSIANGSLFIRSKVIPTFLISKQCINQSIEFSSSITNTDNKAVSYIWDFGDGATATGTTVQHTFTASKSYDVSLTVTDVCGKISTTTQTVQIYNPSIANFTPPASICSNQPVTFTDASVVVNDSIVKWEWDFGNNTISNDKNPTYAFSQAGTQAVSLKITGKSGCQTNILKSVSIKEGPKVGFAVEQTCLGIQTRFKDETILGNGTTFISRSWDFGDNAASTESTPVHTYAQAGTYLVKLTVQNNVGCSVTLTKSIIIRRLPKAAFSTALACAGEGTQFTDASTSADGAITQWEWNFGEHTSSTNISTIANPIHIFEKPGTYQVKLKVTSTFGCADSVTQAITVLSAPKAEFTFQSSCTNREVIFTDASQGSGTSITGYYWDFGDNSTPSTEKSPKHTYTREGAYTVQLTVTSSTRCTNTIQKTIAAGGIAVTLSPDTAVCAEKTVTFRTQVVAPNDPVKSWQWDFGTLGKFTTEAPTVTIPASLTALTVSLTVTTNSGCSTTTTKTIPVRPSAVAQFSYQSASSQPLQITFVNQSTGASRYTWDFGDNTQSSSANPVHTYAKGGIYTITLTALHPNGCESVKSILMPLEVANINQVTIFPNPFTTEQAVTLAFMLPRKQPVSIEIIDLTGRTLQKAVIENTIDGLNNPALSQVLPIISSLGKGMYVITLRYGNTLQLQKVIVQ